MTSFQVSYPLSVSLGKNGKGVYLLKQNAKTERKYTKRKEFYLAVTPQEMMHHLKQKQREEQNEEVKEVPLDPEEESSLGN